jgi:hypothetical protein
VIPDKISDEDLWAGEFGIRYTTLFNVDWRPRTALLGWALKATGAKAVLDVGTNCGWNMRALLHEDPELELRGVDINPWNVVACRSVGLVVYVMRARDIGKEFPSGHDLVIHSGLMIHVPADQLDETVDAVIAASRRWVLAIEYPAAEETPRGAEQYGKLRTWKRPYGQIYQDKGLKLRDEGAAEGYDPDCYFWLLEKDPPSAPIQAKD